MDLIGRNFQIIGLFILCWLFSRGSKEDRGRFKVRLEL